jgi:hypothetical protein
MVSQSSSILVGWIQICPSWPTVRVLAAGLLAAWGQVFGSTESMSKHFQGDAMDLLSNLKNIVEIGVGLLFLVGAIFNVSYTLPATHSGTVKSSTRALPLLPGLVLPESWSEALLFLRLSSLPSCWSLCK